MQDLEKDFQERQAKATDQPKSLWQEVYDIGEEFVEFLEQEIGAKEKKSSKATSAQSRYVVSPKSKGLCIFSSMSYRHHNMRSASSIAQACYDIDILTY